jgi:hypothetical protein
MHTNFNYCDYFQARIERSKTLYVTAFLRSFEHVAFDRCLDAQTGLSEFFVPHAQRSHFLEIMGFLQEQGYIHDLCEMENRMEALR